VTVRTPETHRLTALLAAEGASLQPEGGDRLAVTGLSADRISEIAFQHRVLLHELTIQTASLEDAFMKLTAASAEYVAGEGQ
jgi:ABC-2 type transport system ATP-binding protein